MDKQVFQTDSKQRWNRFKWTLRVILTIMALLLVVFLAMFAMEDSPKVPFRHDYRPVMTANRLYYKSNKTAKDYQSFRRFFHENKMQNKYMQVAAKKRRFIGSGDSLYAKYIAEWNSPNIGIRAGWYVNWDKHSYLSLKQHISHLNLVIPEWFFINPRTYKLESRIDHKGYELMKKSGVPIMPILTNNYNQSFNGKSIGKIIHHPALRKQLISELIHQCKSNHFVGINLDLEELVETSDEYLVSFVAEVSKAFHAHGLSVTQDIEPFNTDYNVKALADYDDYIFVMAYDEHNMMSGPGAICSQNWIEASVDNAAREVPNNKLVLCLASYGYDWTPRGDDNQTVSYRDALSIASDTQAHINFNTDDYNLNFAYRDDNGVTHSVYFTDAITAFNAMRFGTEYGLAGFSVWRLGTEDDRLWKCYDKDMTYQGLTHFNKRTLEPISGSSDVNYLGTGEVLDVLGTPKPGCVELTMDNTDMLITGEDYKKIPSSYELCKYGSAKAKELLLTFDDGPDAQWTPRVLSILNRYHVHAAFFMVGLQIEKNLPIVKDVAKSGNYIGNHTFTHNNVADNTPERTEMELQLTRLLIESITGHSTILFRAPYNADSDPTGRDEIIPIVLARQKNYLDVGESIDPEDWMPGIKADQIYDRVIKGVEHGNGHIILLHDAGGNTRIETIKALPRIIEYLQKKGSRFITLDKYLGRTKAQLMPPITKGKAYYAMQSNLFLATIIYAATDFLTALFLVFIVLGVMRLLFMLVLTLKERRRERRRKFDSLAEMPKVSIIVPAYNEEVNVVSSLRNLLEQDYPNYDIIFVDDGSKDSTYKCVCDAFGDNGKIKILTKKNGGKATALNMGIANTDADYVVCIDADTKLLHDAVSLLIRHFISDDDRHIGAVAGNVKVGNQRNILTRWQAIEYTTSQNFDRQAYASINAITVVPGAIGAFRRKAIEDAGGFIMDTLAEDCDLTMRILKAGYRIENENSAVALTEAPEKLQQFMKQRTRWSFGVMQTFWKHRGLLMNSRYKVLGLWALPNMLVFQFIIPTFSPLADLFMLLGLISGNGGRIFIYYVIFTLVDASVSMMAYLFEHQRISVLLWIIPQRFFYRWIMYAVLFRSYKKALKGELQAWGVLKRTGAVKDV